ncbi:MAG: PRA1 family protein-domain-containing protein [Linnemannia elongata]|nr:MAG: PRA1 family protein-domain-containing protein [Linnemannia elongata]
MSSSKPNYSPLLANPFADSTSQPTTNQSPASLGLGLIEKFRKERLSSLRPIAEFFDTSRMSKPTGIAQITSRLTRNLPYFQGNYTLMFLGITAYSVVSNGMLMFSVAFAVGGTHLISCVPTEGVVIGKNTYNARQLQTGLVCVSVPLFFFSSTIGTIFYIIGASTVGILGHAAIMEETTENRFSDAV